MDVLFLVVVVADKHALGHVHGNAPVVANKGALGHVHGNVPVVANKGALGLVHGNALVVANKHALGHAHGNVLGLASQIVILDVLIVVRTNVLLVAVLHVPLIVQMAVLFPKETVMEDLVLRTIVE